MSRGRSLIHSLSEMEEVHQIRLEHWIENTGSEPGLIHSML